jgi:hypothetical protein
MSLVDSGMTGLLLLYKSCNLGLVFLFGVFLQSGVDMVWELCLLVKVLLAFAFDYLSSMRPCVFKAFFPIVAFSIRESLVDTDYRLSASTGLVDFAKGTFSTRQSPVDVELELFLLIKQLKRI